MRGLSQDAQGLVEDLNDTDKKIRQLIGMQMQLDRRQLNLKVAGLIADLENLQEDVNSELGNNSDTQVYRRSLGRARQLMLTMASSLRDDRSETALIIDEYKQFEALWGPLVNKLRAEDDRYIERGIRRVATSAAAIHQLLLLPQKMDQSQFVYLAKALKKDIDEFFERTPLVLVMGLPNANRALPVANDFYAACARFSEVADQSNDQAAVLAAFRKIEVAERAFVDVYRDVDSDRAVAVLKRIDQSVGALRSSLHVHIDDFDAQAAEELAASVQNLTERIEVVSKRWFSQDRQSFSNDCLQAVADLTDRAARLHDDIVAGKPVSELRNEMTDLYDNWRQVYNYLVKCQTDDRPTLGRLSQNLTPAMVDLRTLILQ